MLGGKPVFSIEVRAEISEADHAAIRKYKLGETALYATYEVVGGTGLLGAAHKLAAKAFTLNVSVNDLTHGKKLECKDILEMLSIEEQIKEAAHTFKAVLEAAKQFGGEEIVEL